MLILATVSITRVIGDNGLLAKTKTASLESEKAKFLEHAKMAFTALGAQMKDEIDLSQITLTDVKNKLVEDYDYGGKIFTIQGGKVFLDAKDIEIGPGESANLLTELSTDEDVHYVYIQRNYYQIKLIDGELSLGTPLKKLPSSGEMLEGELRATIKDEELADVTKDANGDIIITAKDKTGNTELTVEYTDGIKKTVNVHVIEYLADAVEIGEYIDIGVNYNNVCYFNSADRTETKKALTGWRVLNITGSGRNGQVKLVSAGCPLTYCFRKHDQAETAIKQFEDLYNNEVSYTAKGTTGFKSNGFITDKLKSLFKADKGIDTSKGIHVLGCETGDGAKATLYSPLNEFETLYHDITGDIKDMESIQQSHYDEIMNSNLSKVASEHNKEWLDSYNDMLLIGQEVFYGGTAPKTDELWFNDRYGNVDDGSYDPTDPDNNDELEIGLRLVVTLKAGTLLPTQDQEDGKSSSTAYKITVR